MHPIAPRKGDCYARRMPENPTPLRIVGLGSLVLAATFLLTGCFGPSNGPYQGTATVIREDADPSDEDVDTDEEVTSGLSDEQFEEFEQDLDSAETITDEYWRAHWSEFFTGTYESPTVVGLYDGYADDAPTCGGAALGPNNAFYCIPEDYVAWDVTLMISGFATGDTWVYLVIAHEWGHAVQARIDPSLVSEAEELQADCFAGAALFGAAADGNLSIEDGDLAEITTALSTLADTGPWTSSGDHGDPFERIAAFDAGKNGGPAACFPV